MKFISITLAIGTISLIASQSLCGFWLASKRATPKGVASLRKRGISAAAAALVTSVMTILIVSL